MSESNFKWTCQAACIHAHVHVGLRQEGRKVKKISEACLMPIAHQ